MSQTNTGISESIEEVSTLLRDKRDNLNELRERTLVLGFKVQEVQRTLKKVQHAKSYSQYLESLEFGNMRCAELIQPIKSLEIILLRQSLYLYHSAWENVFQQAIAAVIKTIWLTSKQLAQPSAVAKKIGVPFQSEIPAEKVNSCLHFSVEDYLHGVVSLVNDLPDVLSSMILAYLLQSRNLSNEQKNDEKFQEFYKLTATSVIGIRETIDQSVATISSLDLINGKLRRRADSLKYSAKKVDEIVFDLTVRGLLPTVE